MQVLKRHRICKEILTAICAGFWRIQWKGYDFSFDHDHVINKGKKMLSIYKICCLTRTQCVTWSTHHSFRMPKNIFLKVCSSLCVKELKYTTSVVRWKVESQNRCYKKTKTAISYPLIRTCTYSLITGDNSWYMWHISIFNCANPFSRKRHT